MTPESERGLASELATVLADEIDAQRAMGRSDEQLAVLLADRLLEGFDIRAAVNTSTSAALTTAAAYEAAYRFVWQYAERDSDPSESLSLMLVHMEPTLDAARTSDPAAWQDWEKCVAQTRAGVPIPQLPRG